MISTAVVLNQLHAPREKFDLICRIIWSDEKLITEKALPQDKVALLVCGSLVYRYSQADVALLILKGVNEVLDITQDSVVVSVVDELFLSFCGKCWDLTTGQEFSSELPDIAAVESHAIDVKKAVAILEDVSADPQAVREAGEPRSRGQRPMPPGGHPAQAGMRPPYRGRQPWGMGLTGRL